MSAKKILTTIGFALIFLNQLEAQNTWGIKFSPTWNNIYKTDTNKTQNQNPQKMGLNLGLWYEQKIAAKISIQAELLYSLQGRIETHTVFHDDNAILYSNIFTITTHNLNLPLILKIYSLKRFSIEVGAQIGLCLGGSFYSKTESGYYEYKQETITLFSNYETENKQKFYNRLRFGTSIGLSYQTPSHLFFGGRYTFVFTDMTNNYKSKDGTFALNMGFRF